MDPRDGQVDEAGGRCDACGEGVSADRVRVLARRDDVVFAELPCAACGSVGLAIFVPSAAAGPAGALANRPIVPDDVLDMHVFLAGWSGDLRSLVDAPVGPRPPEAA
jgi:hypothetical protein